MEAIIESYLNGQFTQMVEQIEEYGVYTFAGGLHNADISDGEKFDLLRIYLMKKNR